MKLEDVTEAVAKYHPEADLDIIWDAYIYSAKAHRHQAAVTAQRIFATPW